MSHTPHRHIAVISIALALVVSASPALHGPDLRGQTDKGFLCTLLPWAPDCRGDKSAPAGKPPVTPNNGGQRMGPAGADGGQGSDDAASCQSADAWCVDGIGNAATPADCAKASVVRGDECNGGSGMCFTCTQKKQDTKKYCPRYDCASPPPGMRWSGGEMVDGCPRGCGRLVRDEGDTSDDTGDDKNGDTGSGDEKDEGGGNGGGGECSATPAITQYSLGAPRGLKWPASIVLGSDGNLWFTEVGGRKIGRITPQGSITEFAVPESNEIAAGPDGALWFTMWGLNKIGRITTSGTLSEYAVPTAHSTPNYIVAGPDGALWFTEEKGNKIGRITTNGVITEFPLPVSRSSPSDIAVGPDGALWFTQYLRNAIGRITTTGAISEFALPTGTFGGGIVAGPDGALWFTEFQYINDRYVSKIGRMTTTGALTHFSSQNSGATDITVGPDGNLWFSGHDTHKIGRLTTAGITTMYDINVQVPWPNGIATGPNGTIWFTESQIGNVAVFDPRGLCARSG